MSFIGNLAAASSAKAIGKYNASVAYQEALYERKKAAVKQKVYETVEKAKITRSTRSTVFRFLC
jgi:hypothetical protein